MFKKILIANRGEIACRIIRACQRLNITTVAVYSTADKEALFVKQADETYCIGPAAAKDSYLNRETILMAGIIANVDAIHPGYGFLAEDSLFAQMCAQCDITWLGPSAKLISLMGNKSAARKFAAGRGIAIIPGTFVLNDVTQAKVAANKIGYPLLIKASQGGGGKGIRQADDEKQLLSQLVIAKQEAEFAFDNSAIYLEKVLADIRHIEVQVIGDQAGTIQILGDRDCTLQHRRQKVVEESPASFITEAQRRELTQTVHQLLDHVGYQGLGTVEFLFSQDRFYFLEMNTRLQVEHGVTETTTGLDIVLLQLQLAANEGKLPDCVPMSDGVAIECRLQLTGTAKINQLTSFSFPDSMRVDTGYQQGDYIPPYYDALLAKMIISADTRTAAIAKMSKALAEVEIDGVPNNLSQLEAVVSSNWFLSNEFSVTTLDARKKANESTTN
ncbi:acetyl-CoA carboxylase biotin carboxylase subunit [Paucilactobacillus wasatchensis]|uniref:biotin carboxylase n=1 Tax=Paucilactobacillus wasatchensis TaxID=1335616 RepID=A0A0D0YWZ9_9LACO|nr:biotin carboxylase N-terminal domain-containing protein [Paucilactobacillus wasatchensis]KIS03779.1 Biotin carboxylase of acetyl-CoA carboxylase [Paucilactobacillus wasatchensis]